MKCPNPKCRCERMEDLDCCRVEWCPACGATRDDMGQTMIPKSVEVHVAMRETLADQRTWIAMLNGWVRNGEAAFDFDAFKSAVEAMGDHADAALALDAKEPSR